jgi:hypothetical protein
MKSKFVNGLRFHSHYNCQSQANAYAFIQEAMNVENRAFGEFYHG